MESSLMAQKRPEYCKPPLNLTQRNDGGWVIVWNPATVCLTCMNEAVVGVLDWVDLVPKLYKIHSTSLCLTASLVKIECDKRRMNQNVWAAVPVSIKGMPLYVVIYSFILMMKLRSCLIAMGIRDEKSNGDHFIADPETFHLWKASSDQRLDSSRCFITNLFMFF